MRASIIVAALALAAVTIDAGIVRKRQVDVTTLSPVSLPVDVTTVDPVSAVDGLLTTVDGLLTTIEDELPTEARRRKRQVDVTTISPVSLPVDVTAISPVSLPVDVTTVDGLLTTIEDELPTEARRRKRQVDVTTLSPVSLPVDVTTVDPVSAVDGLISTVDGLLTTVEDELPTEARRRKRQVDVTTISPVSLPVDVTTVDPVSAVDGLISTVDDLVSTTELPVVERRRKRQVDVTTGAPSGIVASGFTPATPSA